MKYVTVFLENKVININVYYCQIEAVTISYLFTIM